MDSDHLMNKTEIVMDGLELQECIGKGAYGEVYRASIHIFSQV
jgi:hypothetical protein